MNWSKTFEKVEEAMGFKLYDWQKDYISMEIDDIPVGGRGNGKTVAFILRHLLNYEDKLIGFNHPYECEKQLGSWYWSKFPVDETYITVAEQKGYYEKLVKEIDRKLKSVGLETCFK